MVKLVYLITKKAGMTDEEFFRLGIPVKVNADSGGKPNGIPE
jgi:hypothetical protein